jgi:ubiquinone biosynthesis protein
MPRDFVLFGKSIVTTEGITLLYYPNFKFGDRVQPFLEDIILERYSPENVVRKGINNFFGLKKILSKLPWQTTRILDKFEQGKIKIEMRDTDIQKLSVELDRSSNRLSYGMIIAALLVSGSLVINVGDKIFAGLPLFSLVSFSFAIIIGFILFVSILKEGKK